MNKIKISIIGITLIVFAACQESSSEAENVVSETTPKEEVVKNFDYYMERISNDPQWMNDIKKQALEQGMTVDSALVKNAKYMAKQNGFVDEADRQNEVITQIEIIKNSPEWYQTVEAQAKERNISVDEMLVRSAEYVIEQRNNKTK